jgi:elongation factor Ts
MANISATDVKKLRDRTNAPFGECKTALTETGGDMDKAIRWLQEKHKGLAVSKGERETAEGRIGTFVDLGQKVGGIIEVRCESAPSAKNELFVQLTNDLAKQVAYEGAQSVQELLAQKFVDAPSKTVTDRINDVIGLIRENMKPARLKHLTGVLGSYVHHDGSVGVLLQVEGDRADAQLLRDICMHITARNPTYARREDVPAEVVAREKEIAKAQIASDPKNASKPPNILDKIAEGKLKTWYAENVLVDQLFVKDDTKTVGQLLKSAGLKLLQFVRYKVGELS